MIYIRLDFWNTCQTDALYESGFKQTLYLDTNIMSTPAIEEDGSVDRDNEFQPTFRKWANRQEIEVICPEYLIDALSGMQLCDHIFLTRKTGEQARIKNVTLDTEWRDCYALVKIGFNVDYYVMDVCCEAECESCTPTIDDYTVAGAYVTLTGTGCPGLIQVQELVGASWQPLGSPITGAAYESVGAVVSPTTSPTSLRVYAYDNSCVYGYSEAVEFCLGLVCAVTADTGVNTVRIKGTAGKEVVLNWGDGNVDSITMNGVLNSYTNSYTAGSYLMGISGDVDFISQLQLQNCDIDSYLGLECFTGLVSINFTDNNITALNSGELDLMPLLSVFNFETNSITSIPAGYFDNNTALTQVTMQDNELTALAAGLFDNNISIVSLDFSGNSISSLGVGLLDNLATLLQLDLGDNSLVTLNVGLIDNNVQLATLALNNNPLTAVPANFLANNSQMKLLFINECALADVDYIFNELAGFVITNGFLFANGGTNAPLTGGAANADLITLQGRGWTCSYN